MQDIDNEIRLQQPDIEAGSPLDKLLSDKLDFKLPSDMVKPELTESTVNKKLTTKVSQNFSFGSQHEKKFNREDFFPNLYLEK